MFYVFYGFWNWFNYQACGAHFSSFLCFLTILAIICFERKRIVWKNLINRAVCFVGACIFIIGHVYELDNYSWVDVWLGGVSFIDLVQFRFRCVGCNIFYWFLIVFFNLFLSFTTTYWYFLLSSIFGDNRWNWNFCYVVHFTHKKSVEKWSSSKGTGCVYITVSFLVKLITHIRKHDDDAKLQIINIRRARVKFITHC